MNPLLGLLGASCVAGERLRCAGCGGAIEAGERFTRTVTGFVGGAPYHEPVFEIPDEEIYLGGYRVTFGAHQREDRPLPAVRYPDGDVHSRWRLSEDERRAILDGANIDVSLFAFGHPLQPLSLSVQGVAPEQVLPVRDITSDGGS